MTESDIMTYQENSHISNNDLMFKGVLHDIKKSKTALQPVFEAFTNALEAIKIRQKEQQDLKGKIEIEIRATEIVGGGSEFASLIISDNGIGFTSQEFKRFNIFKDFTKGYKNLGSGRIQYAHYFDNTVINSIYRENNKTFEREFVVSKKESFLNKNAIVFNKFNKETERTDIGTRIEFNVLLENRNIYSSLTDETLKTELLSRYIHYFCHNKQSLPEITIQFYVQSVLKSETKIQKTDIPQVDKQEKIKIKYSKVAADAKSIEYSDKEEEFVIDAFKISGDILKANDLKLVSKGEVVEESNVSLQSLSENDRIKGHKYLFLVSSDYIDARDTNMRGELRIPDRDSFAKSSELFTPEEIVFEDIQETVNETINQLYPEIKEVKEKHNKQLEELKEMFLLNEDSSKDIKISVNDSESEILEKFYKAEAKKSAAVDAEIKRSIDRLNKLDTTSEKYSDELKQEVENLVKTIPLQNKTSLTHYVARRKLVLDLFDKILNRELDVQNNGERQMDEALIHNLLFQQSAGHPEQSDLWIINEDFIYFKGSSETQLSKLEIEGRKVFKEKFSEEEEKYLTSLGENRKIKRPDVLLFPSEGKCIIIEFKAPDVNVSEHLTQIDMYAYLIRNFTIDDVQITTFYGYLIGESIEPRDVLARVSRYEQSYHFNYLFRPSETVHAEEGRTKGSIYSEVIKYSTLLERARIRNSIFINKLHSI